MRLKTLDQRTVAAAHPFAPSRLPSAEGATSAEVVAAAARLPASEVDPPLRAELEAMQTKNLRNHAKADGANAQHLEMATDADDPKATAVELVLSLLY
jgi:hypothetical protein